MVLSRKKKTEQGFISNKYDHKNKDTRFSNDEHR